MVFDSGLRISGFALRAQGFRWMKGWMDGQMDLSSHPAMQAAARFPKSMSQAIADILSFPHPAHTDVQIYIDSIFTAWAFALA